METRICKKCEEKKDIEEFKVANVIKGKEYRRWTCVQCKTSAQTKRREEIKSWYFNLKKTFRCQQCDEDRYYCLDFHHTNPEEKEISIGEAIQKGWGKTKILEEISKCDIYCSNCHRELHWKERQ